MTQVKLNKFVRDVGSAGQVIDVPDAQAHKLIGRGVAQLHCPKPVHTTTPSRVIQQQNIAEFDEDGEPVNQAAYNLTQSKENHE